MIYIVVDIEADGPAPGLYSMVELGAVAVDSNTLKTVGTFDRLIAPISDNYTVGALNAIGRTREDTINHGRHPRTAMQDFAEWLDRVTPEGERRWMVADNAGFDWMFVCWYCHRFLGSNPLGFSCFSLTSFVKGVRRNMRSTVHSLRDTPHKHNALADAQGNAEALIKLLKEIQSQ
jgi:DNA polymerase III alpha subunit (gram-positive type)